MKQVRVRFAPSPTGPLHIGGVRTALYNYLFAKKHGGKFILRIEDTDQTRFVPGAEDYILESLKWCGIKPDEGQSVGGEFGPYKQSERKALYQKYVQQLLDDGKAYYAFDTPEALSKLRDEAESQGQTFMYGAQNRACLENSLALSPEELKQRLDTGVPYVVRFKMPVNEEVFFKDLVRGAVKVNTASLDDKILFKSDGMPTYHLANVVDDYLMQISHVIRGEEWLPSCPLHVLLYQAFGWTEATPDFAHLPLLLKPTGKGKLSKRDGDKLGFPVFPMEWKNPENGEVASGYKEEGYYPVAFVNMLAFLGWNPGTEKEIYSLKELEADFSLERVGKAGARFNKEKAVWFNNQYLQAKPDTELVAELEAVLKAKEIQANHLDLARIVDLVKERANFSQDLYEQSAYFYQAPTSYDPKTVKKFWKGEIDKILQELVELFTSIPKFEAASIKEQFSAYMNERELGFGKVMNPLRLCLVGSNMGPDLFELIEILGLDEVKNRIVLALKALPLDA